MEFIQPKPGCRELDEAEKAIQEKLFITARSRLTSLLANPPSDLETRQRLVAALIACGSYRDAVPALDSTLTWYPGDQVSIRQRAECRAHLGDFEGALHDAEESIRFSGESADTLRTLYRCQVIRKDWKAALEAARRLTEHVRDDYVLWLDRGIYACDAGEYEEADECWRQAEVTNPSCWQSSYNLSLLALIRKDRDAAIPLLLRAIAIAPKEELPRSNLLWIVWQEVGPLSRVQAVCEVLFGNPGLSSHRWERLNRFTPEVIDLFRQERRRDRRRWFIAIPVLFCMLAVPLGALAWTYRLVTVGVAGAHLNSGWLAAYLLLLLASYAAFRGFRRMLRQRPHLAEHQLPPIPTGPS